MTGDTGPQPTRPGAVLGGVVVGVLGAIFYLVVVGLALYSSGNDLDGTDLVSVIYLIAPAVVGIVLLLVPRTRRAGAGFVIGVAVGMIVLPGVCTLPLLGG